MTLGELEQAIKLAYDHGLTPETPITIQLPDQSTPVDFIVEDFDKDMANIFPLPDNRDEFWDIETNVITSSQRR